MVFPMGRSYITLLQLAAWSLPHRPPPIPHTAGINNVLAQARQIQSGDREAEEEGFQPWESLDGLARLLQEARQWRWEHGRKNGHLP